MSGGEYTGRPNNAGPSSDVFPLSASVASSPAILITGTSAAGQTTAHTADAVAFDQPYIRIDNVAASAITVYANLGSTATTGNRAWTINAGSFAVAYSYDILISKSGVLGFWATATAGIYVSCNVNRVYTASS